jgi:DnaJ-class molecular chaperone
MVVDSTLYEILGVSPDIDEASLKRAYKKRVFECHPDKHPDDPCATEKFQRLNEAWEILKDPEKRRVYDERGPEGLREGGAHGLGDLLNNLFGFGGGQAHRPRTRDIVTELPVGLADLFGGAERTVRSTRKVPCAACGGGGCRPGFAAQPCAKCNGQGRVIAMQPVAGGYVQAIVQCPDCAGIGQSIDPEGKCEKCAGDGFEEETREYTVQIACGMEDGDRIVFQGAAHEVQNADTGDLVVIVREEPHPLFERRHRELLLKKDLTLSDALFAARFVVEHLDGRKIVVTTQRRRVISTGMVDVIPGEGMPSRGDPSVRGNLYIQYTVVMPEYKDLTKQFRHAVCKVVPHRDGAKGVDLTAEDVVQVEAKAGELDDFVNAEKERREHRNEAYRSDGDAGEEEDAEGQNVGCAPM